MKQQLLSQNRFPAPCGDSVPKFFRLGLLVAVAVAIAANAPAQVPAYQTVDKVKSYVGALRGATFTVNGAGHTAKTGDYAMDMASGYVFVDAATWLNAATTNDELAVSFWQQKRGIANSSAFWLNSPSSNNGQRGFQAHVPWDTAGNIYFDTAGCCDPTNRITASIDTFSDYTGDVSYWTNWHFFVFTKKAGAKEIWIDGKKFLDQATAQPGVDAGVLPTDFISFAIGAAGDGTSIMGGLMDDFSVYGTALSEAEIGKLFTGTLPTALPATDKLVAYWDFNDYPAEGVFKSFSPAANVQDAAPNLIRIVHEQGATPWTASNVTLKLDGTAVTPTVTAVGALETVSFAPSPFLAIQTKHAASFTYPSAGGSKTIDWSFRIGAYTKDSVASRVGVFEGGSTYSLPTGGHTGNAGDYGADFGKAGTGPVYVNDVSFMNTAAANDEMTFALWIKDYNIAASSAFWAQSASLNDRGWQAHVPWSDDTIYFDTAGCCTADTQRINANINTFDAYNAVGSDDYWTNWHFFVFSKKAADKQIWIDGKLFLEGTSAAPLLTDFAYLNIGATAVGVNLIHAIVDDFSVYSTQLTEADINSLYTGTLPSAMPAAKGLLAYWDFNDIPAAGLFTSVYPAPDATNAAPNLIKVVHMDGTTVLDPTKVSLKLDGAAVAATATKAGGFITVTYVPSPLLAANSAHTAQLLYDGQPSFDWAFTVGTYTKSVVNGYVGVLEGPARFTADAAGHSGAAGDFAIDMGHVSTARQAVHLVGANADFLNTAAANDEMCVVGWEKLYGNCDSTLLWGVSPSSNGTSRGWGAYAPWSNGNIYFDTAGCCDAATQRINAPITDITDYSGDPSWWTNWHHLVFQKKAEVKEIWIDGKLFLSGTSTSPLPTDFTDAYFGLDPADNSATLGILDDVAIFGTSLDEATIGKLASGTLPNALPASTKLLAYFDFNDGKPAAGGNQPAELGQTLNGFQDDFTGAQRDPNWVPVGPAGDAYVQADGVLKSFANTGDPNHLLYMGPGGSNTVEEVLARVRVVNFGNDDFARGGIVVNSSANVQDHTNNWIGENLHFRNVVAGGDAAPALHFKLLDDNRAWGPQNSLVWSNNTWYWLRLKMDPAKVDGTNVVVGKAWLADGNTAEPADWQMKWAAPPAPMHGGYAGISGCSSSGAGKFGLGQFEVDYILIKAASLPSITVAFGPNGPAAMTKPFFTSVASSGGTNVLANWFGVGALQTAPAVSGPWTNQTNKPPAVIPLTGTNAVPMEFLRIQQ